MDVEGCIDLSAKVAGYFPLNKEQKDVVIKFMSGNDVFFCSPERFRDKCLLRDLPKSMFNHVYVSCHVFLVT